VVEYGTSIEQFAQGTLKHCDKFKAAPYQTDRETSQQYVNNLLGRPNTEEELDDKCNEFESNQNAVGNTGVAQTFGRALAKGDKFDNATNEIRLRFTRTHASCSTPDTGKQRGKYDALVTVTDKASRFYGKTILNTTTNDWVEDNFTEESLAIVQAVAEETNRVYQLKNSSKKEQGFLPLDKPLKYTVDQKDLQISKMQYVPPKRKEEMQWEM
jgi:hypothetical protein